MRSLENFFTRGTLRCMMSEQRTTPIGLYPMVRHSSPVATKRVANWRTGGVVGFRQFIPPVQTLEVLFEINHLYPLASVTSASCLLGLADYNLFRVF